MRFVQIDPDDAEARRTRLAPGDLLISITADIGIIGYVDDKTPAPAYINQHIARVRLNHRLVDSRFVAYYLASWEPQRRFVGSTDQGAKAGMNLTTVAALSTVVPPLKEQSHIADALADADGLIATLERLIAKKQSIKQGMMQQLFTGRARLPGFSGEWSHAQLSSVGTVITGGTPPTSDRSNYGGDHLFASPADLGRSKYVTTTEKMLSNKGFARSRRVPAGSTLFVCIGSTIGKVGIAAQDLATNQQINSIIPHNDVDAEYLYYAATTLSSLIREQAGEQAVPLVNKSQFSMFEILLPPYPEQQAIASTLADTDDEIAALQTRLQKALAIKQGMMQQLLTGRTRLPV